MPREGGDPALLWDMLESAQAIVSMVEGFTFDSYCSDRRTRRAIEREIEIIGEAARSVSEAFRSLHPEVPWRKIIAQRHKIAHEYGEIQDEIIWIVAIRRIPELIELLKPLVRSAE